MKTRQMAAEGVLTAPSAESTEVEVWKDIPGYEGRYQASSFGQIKSLERTVAFGKQRRIVREHVLKKRKHSNSEHRTVGFWDSKLNRSTTQMVHQLVLRAFVGLPPNGCEILHINGDPTDNRLCNLRYGSHAENGIDRYQHAHAGLLLNQEQVREIKKLLDEGLPQTEIARRYGCSQTNISRIKRGALFQWVI